MEAAGLVDRDSFAEWYLAVGTGVSAPMYSEYRSLHFLLWTVSYICDLSRAGRDQHHENMSTE